MSYPVFPLILPIEYQSEFQSKTVEFKTDSAFEDVKPRSFFNNVTESFSVEFQIPTGYLQTCIDIVKQKLFEIKKNETETVLVRCSKYSVREEPNISILTISVREIFMP